LIAESQRIIRPHRDGIAPEQAVAVDFDGFDRDAQLGLVRREVSGDDLADAQLPPGLLRGDRATHELSRRRDGSHRE
jgi:hypothetical protein